jgi:hypothetical protein
MNGPYRKPQADLYTALLAIALAAVIVATIFAYLETSDYGDQKYRGAPPAPVVLTRPSGCDGDIGALASASGEQARRLTVSRFYADRSCVT